jgi:hypothetical protein
MIKAASLFYVIVISLLIAIVSSSIILYAYLSRTEFEDFKIDQRLHLNVSSGLQLLMSSQSVIDENTSKTFHLFDNKTNDSLMLSRKWWGAYEILISRAFLKKKVVEQVAEVGYYADTTNSYSLYIADEDKPLALCGKSVIKGIVYLPKAGVKRAYIEGQSFIGDRLIDGQIRVSNKKLPSFNKNLFTHIETLFLSKSITDKDSIMSIDNELSLDTLVNSFKNIPIIISSNMPLKILNGFFSGNILIVSDKQITINSKVNLKDIILCAPKITFEAGFKGNLQAFASDSILLNTNVILTYPSVLGIIPNSHSPNTACIVLNENDSVSGSIFAFKNEAAILQQVGIKINKKVTVYGQLYSNGYTDIQGIISGSVMCTKISLSTPSSVYENHLLNAVIDQSKLSNHFVGINLVEESTVKKVVKWLE